LTLFNLGSLTKIITFKLLITQVNATYSCHWHNKRYRMKNCLLLGRKGIIVDDIKGSIDTQNINLFGGTNLKDVKDTFAQNKIDIVIMGAGLEINDRLDIISYIFETSKSTTVHMKDWDSGPTGMLPFVNGVLNGQK